MNLAEIRKKIDVIDERLMKLLAERMSLMPIILKYKEQRNIPIIQKKREEEILIKRRKLAEKLKLNPDFAEKLFSNIIDESVKIQEKYKNTNI